jgi:hypothetical protein
MVTTGFFCEFADFKSIGALGLPGADRGQVGIQRTALLGNLF